MKKDLSREDIYRRNSAKKTILFFIGALLLCTTLFIIINYFANLGNPQGQQVLGIYLIGSIPFTFVLTAIDSYIIGSIEKNLQLLELKPEDDTEIAFIQREKAMCKKIRFIISIPFILILIILALFMFT